MSEEEEEQKEIDFEPYESEKALSEALLIAKKAFYHHIEDAYDYDGAFFSISLTGWTLSINGFQKMTKIEIEDEDENKEPLE